MRAGFDVERMRAEGPGDAVMLAIIVLLAGTGIAALWSASPGYAVSIGKAPVYFVIRQILFLAPSVIIFWSCAIVDLERLRSKIGFIVLACLAALLLPFLGGSRNGAFRWIDLGITTLQPSELWKPVMILYLAHILDRKRERILESPGVLIPPFLLAATGCLLVFAQNDFSTAFLTILAAAAVFWIACAPPSFFIGLASAAASLSALSILTSDFRLRRILAFLFPAYEPHGQGYQVLGSLRAIRSGGLLGKGLGLGTLKTGAIPEVQSDFIFAAWAEETGLVGVLLVMAAWGALGWRAFKAALAEEDHFRSCLGFGLAFLLVLEALVNMGVASGAVPATGLALPFFSAGGSSLLSTAAICGLLYNLSRPSASRGADRGADRGGEGSGYAARPAGGGARG
jgi:cell division protein FtsW